MAWKEDRTQSRRERGELAEMQHNEITGTVVDTAIGIHRRFGPGLFESLYRKLLAYELR